MAVDDYEDLFKTPPKTLPYGRRPLLPLLDIEPRLTVASIMKGRTKPQPGYFVQVVVHLDLADGCQREIELRITSFQAGFGLVAVAECPMCGENSAKVLMVIDELPYLVCRHCRKGTYWSTRRGRRRPYKLVWRPLRQAQRLRQRAAHTRNKDKRETMLREADEHVLAAHLEAVRLRIRLPDSTGTAETAAGVGAAAGMPAGPRSGLPGERVPVVVRHADAPAAPAAPSGDVPASEPDSGHENDASMPSAMSAG